MVGGDFGSIGLGRYTVSDCDLLHAYGSGVGKWMDGDGDCCLVLAGLSLEAGDEGAREHQRA